MVDISNAQKVEGWTFDGELLWLAQQAQNKKDILEVGCWKGRSSRSLADNSTGHLFFVDHFSGPKDIENYSVDFADVINLGPEYILNQFMNNMSGHHERMTVINKLSTESYHKLLEDYGPIFDFIFLDAGHDYDSIKEDIQNYRNLLSVDGLLSGHDYSPAWPGVQRAVNELLPLAQVAPNTTIWFINEESIER